MFERFTRPARTAIELAVEEARSQGETTLRAEHLLYGVLTDTSGAPAVVLRAWGVDAARVSRATRGAGELDEQALSALGIDLVEVRRRAEDAFGPGALDPPRRSRSGARVGWGYLPFTTEARNALLEALRAARRDGVREIGSTHLLLGLLAVEEGTALVTLRHLGVTVSAEELTRRVRAERDEAA